MFILTLVIVLQPDFPAEIIFRETLFSFIFRETVYISQTAPCYQSFNFFRTSF